jgi:hypothetical protein
MLATDGLGELRACALDTARACAIGVRGKATAVDPATVDCALMAARRAAGDETRLFGDEISEDVENDVDSCGDGEIKEPRE